MLKHKEESMALMLRCADSGAKCAFQVTAETKEELMEHVKVHAAFAHPEMAQNPPPPEAIQSMIHEV
jgi:predicted small metal-binding protein